MVGIFAIAALGFLVAHLWRNAHNAAATPSPQPRSAPSSVATTQHATSAAATTATLSITSARTTTSANGTTTAVTTHPAATSAAATGVVSLLVAARNDTWLEVRSGSSTGPLLYSGTLVAASTKTFRARGLWARFGAAGNLSARLDGKPIRLPSGTYSAIFDHHGFRRVGT